MHERACAWLKRLNMCILETSQHLDVLNQTRAIFFVNEVAPATLDIYSCSMDSGNMCTRCVWRSGYSPVRVPSMVSFSSSLLCLLAYHCVSL